MRNRLQALTVCLLALALVTGCGGDEGDGGSGSGKTTAGSGSGSGSGLGAIPSQLLMAAVAGPPVKVNADLGGLVPGDAVAVLHVGSPDELVDGVRRIATSFDPGMASQVQMDTVLGFVSQGIPGLRPDMIDPARPMAVALTLPPEGGDGEPRPTRILPLRDAGAARQSIEKAIAESPFKPEGGSPATFAGSYVAFTSGFGGAATSTGATPAIAKDLPAGGISLRVDLARLVEQYGGMARSVVDEGLDDAARGVPPGQEGVTQIFDSVKNGIGDLIDSVEMLELGLGVEGTEVSFLGRLSMKPGSPLASLDLGGGGDLADFAARLPADAPIAMLASMDIEKLYEWMQPLMDSMLQAVPEEQRASMMEQWQDAMALSEHLDGRVALAMSFGANGVSGVEIIGAKDPKAYMNGFDAMLDGGWLTMLEEMGIHWTKDEGATGPGQHFRMKFDMEKLMSATGAPPMPPEQRGAMDAMMSKLFGADGLKMAMATADDRIVATFGGGDAALERGLAAGAPGPVSPALGRAMALGGERPCFVLHLDARSFTRQVLALAAEIVPPSERERMPSIPDGAPIPFDLAVGTDRDGTVKGGIRVEVGELAKLITMFMGRTEAPAPERR